MKVGNSMKIKQMLDLIIAQNMDILAKLNTLEGKTEDILVNVESVDKTDLSKDWDKIHFHMKNEALGQLNACIKARNA